MNSTLNTSHRTPTQNYRSNAATNSPAPAANELATFLGAAFLLVPVDDAPVDDFDVVADVELLPVASLQMVMEAAAVAKFKG
jgi:hypothetical protein